MNGATCQKPSGSQIRAVPNSKNDTGKTFHIHNRKYLGSKYRVLPFLKQTILDAVNPIGTFIDGFAGTGVVACYFRPYADRIIANDLLYSNYVTLRAFLTSCSREVDMDKIADHICRLNQLQPAAGYVSASFGGTYFTLTNAGLIDAVRERIESMYRSGSCTLQEKLILLTSLLFAADKAANTIGQYDAFMKHIGSAAFDETGSHKVDSNVYKRLRLLIPAIVPGGHDNRVYNKDFNSLVSELRGDVLYLDPPYNTRQYIDNYHVLENIMHWDKPALSGKTRKFKRDHLKSRYSRKRQAGMALEELICAARVKHIFLSYNNEGIIPDQEIIQILSARGRVEIYESDYRIFGGGAGRAGKRAIKERIFHCRIKS